MAVASQDEDDDCDNPDDYEEYADLESEIDNPRWLSAFD